jgi:hypothetical protein
MRDYYEIEFLIDQDVTLQEFKKAREAAVKQINEWLNEKTAPETAKEALDPAELDKLPWKPYREGHRAAWIFSNTEGAEKLVEALKEKGKLEIDEYAYRFSGPKDDPKRFISRNPTKPRENKSDCWKRSEQALKNIKKAGQRLTGQ